MSAMRWYEPNPTDAWAAEVMGAWLRDWRHRTGATQRRLARLAGIDQGGLSRLERGLGRPGAYRLARLVVALDWLSGGGDPAGPFVLEGIPRPDRTDTPPEYRPPAVIGPMRRPRPPLFASLQRDAALDGEAGAAAPEDPHPQ
jgi:transcriptional regulator with XRE-family HTH domain